MKKKVLTRIICCVSVIVVLALLVSVSQFYVFRAHGRDRLRIDGFRNEPKNSLDVVLIGASDIYTSFSSCLAYDEYGFTSYPYTAAAMPVSLWKTILIDVLEHQDPKLIVVELNGCVYDNDKQLYSNAAAHYVLDGMPVCKNKIDTLNMLPCGTIDDPKSSFYLPFIKYHSDWPKVFSNRKNIANVFMQDSRGYSLLKGVSTQSKIDPCVDGARDVSSDFSERELYAPAEAFLRDFLQYCRDEQIENIVFVRFPHRIGTDDNDNIYKCYQYTNAAARIVQEYGYEYVNFEAFNKEIGIDPDHDFYNSNHLNVYGQIKFTEYFARWLSEEKNITPSELDEDLKDEWDTCAKYYQSFCDYVQTQAEEKNEQTYAESFGMIRRLTKQFEQEAKP